MDLKKRAKSFLEDTGATVTAFCKKIEVSPTYYYKWMKNKVEFSEKLTNRITEYLNEVYAK